MGQSYYIVNVDKEQFIRPHKFGDGYKLLEFGPSGHGTMLALSVLLADGNGRGGGDLQGVEDLDIVGSWAGDRIVIAGDYADGGHFVPYHFKTWKNEQQPTLYALCEDHFEDVSAQVWEALLRDEHIRTRTEKRLSGGDAFLLLCNLGEDGDPKLTEVFQRVFGKAMIVRLCKAWRF